MGTQNCRFRTIGNIDEKEKERQKIQTQIDGQKSIESRRQLGQFSTPLALAKEIISYGLTLQNENKISFFEPAFGTGSFYSALLSQIESTDKCIANATGVEVDNMFFAAAKDLWDGYNINLINSDFTECECTSKYNFLVSNPPYVRHHFINQTKKVELAKSVLQETGLSFTGLAGLYCYFILLSHKWLTPNAISGWLIPSEFMDVNYGSTLKDYLLNKVHLIRIHRYNPQNCQFDDATVSSCVVWFKNETILEDYDIEFSYGGTHNNPEKSIKVKKHILENYRKWTHFPSKDIKSNQSNSSTFVLGDFFSIKRGLATGDNNFFILSKEQIIELDLDMSFFTPILPSPRYLKCNEILADKDGYPLLDTQYFLLNCTMEKAELQSKFPSMWNYLAKGEETTAQKYLCKSRKMWYLQEAREVTPFLCSYMGRGSESNSTPFRFVLNHSDAIATNSYLMLYPKQHLQDAISKSPDALNTVWNILSHITKDDLESEGRVYGGGLKKIEPRELALVRCPHLAELI